MHAYLDMDGVIADFITGFCNKIGHPEWVDQWDSWTFYQDQGISADLFWRLVKDAELYATLPKLEFADEIVGLLHYHFDSVTILSSCGYSNPIEIRRGKMVWLQENYPHLAKNPIFEHNKTKYCREDAVLIDDSGRNVKKWREAGGKAILVPQLANELRGRYVLGHLEQQIRILHELNA